MNNVQEGLVRRFKEVDNKGNNDEEHAEEDVALQSSTKENQKSSHYRLLKIHEVPEHLRINKYIMSGYRGHLNTRLCLDSIFWWTNEALNIWTHIFGFMLFFGFTVRDYWLIKDLMPTLHLMHAIFPQICFQITMIFSVLYHTFMCRSEKDHQFFLALDMFGIVVSMMAGFLTAIYYGFICLKEWQQFYFRIASVVFVVMMVLHNPWRQFSPALKRVGFGIWFFYSFIPTIHWFHLSGGFDNTLVQHVVPRLLTMYAMATTALFFYYSEIPERLMPGRFDYVGSSHQLWHIIALLGYMHTHNSGTMFLQYGMNNGCPQL